LPIIVFTCVSDQVLMHDKKNSEYKYFVIDTLTHIQKPVEMCIMFEINKKHV